MKPRKGKVTLVGGGPGDPGLLTLAGAEALRKADAVVYDWLVSPELLRLAPQAEKIFVGKRGGTHSKEQGEIHQIFLRLARQGKQVVRLKGGDPFIFGRGGEEAVFLSKQKIEFEIIPGVSAGIGAPAYAGIPLTDRRFASQVTFVTGHEDPAKAESTLDWKRLAEIGGTLVSFMGVKNLPQIVKSLLRGGKPSKTPVAVIEWGTLPKQRVVVGTLGDIYKKALKAKIESPALTVIGEVVKLRKTLAWFEKRPLLGKTVVVTRARAQASELVKRLSEQGAEVFEFPAIQILPPRRPELIDREIFRLSDYDWAVFTSANGVGFFFERAEKRGKDSRIFSGVKVAAIGETTAEALREKGIVADLIPGAFTSEALFEALKKAGEIRGKNFLLARADLAPPRLRHSLEKEGARVVEVEAYRTRPAKEIVGAPLVGARGRAQGPPLHQWIRGRKIDYITFTSSSTVRNFFEAIPAAARKKLQAKLVSIGPVTSETIREYGFRPAREARVHTIEGLIDALTNGSRR